MVSERVVCREFVGRIAELQHLRARRRGAAEGRGGVVLIAGEAGIGKSRLVREFCGQLASGRHQIAAAACRPFAQRPLSALADLLRSPDGASPFDERTVSRDAQLGSVLTAFDQVAARGTAILVLDDLQWADGELLAILDVLAERAAARRVLLIGTYREDEILPAHPLFVAFGRLLRREGVSLLRLEPLAGDDAERLLYGALGTESTLAPETLRGVLQRSGGNPLFTEELLRHVVDRERSGEATARAVLPMTLQAVVHERLVRCAPDERGVLAQASVFGRRFRGDVLAEVVGVPLAALVAPLQRLCELQLLDPRDGVPHGFQFRHALTRDAVYAELLPAQTRPLHARIARTLATRDDAPQFAEMIAYNYWEAGEPAAAAPHCNAAGDAAWAVHAYDDAASWYERAARGFEQTDPAAEARARANSAEMLMRGDAIDRVQPAREAAAAAFLRAGDFERFVEQRTYIIGTLGNDARTDDARAFGDETLALLPPDQERLRGPVAVRLAALEAAARRPDAAEPYLSMVDESALPVQGAIEYHAIRSSIFAQRSQVTAWRAAFGRALELADSGGCSMYLRRWLCGTIAVQALALGEMTVARAQQMRSLTLSRANFLHLDYALAVMAQIELRSGNVAEAGRLIGETRPTREFLSRLHRALTAIGVAIALDDRTALEQLIELDLIESGEAGGNNFTMIEAACGFGDALAALGRTREAAPLLQRAAAAIANTFGLAESIATLIRRAPQVAITLRPLLADRARADEDRVNRALLTLLDAASAADSDQRRDRATEAAAAFAALGWPLFEAQAFELAGEVDAATALYRRCGAEAEARRILRVRYARAADAGSVLTPREQAIAEHVAAGKGNRAIAAALAVSEKSVEKSLTSIYAKLGLRTRTELAASIARGGGEGAPSP